MWLELYKTFSRRKPLTDSAESKLAKVLSTFDLTALGIGSTLGVGVYVLAGGVSKNTAGPAIVISFLIAAIASVFAGLCYAEFGARVPKAGSAYVYSYVTIGEFIAFVIGWNLILEYAIGSAGVVKGLSTYLDSLFGYVMRDYLTEHIPINTAGLSAYPDFFSLGVTLIFSIALALGAKESSYVNNIFTITNLSVVLFVIIAGCFKVNVDNWNIPKEKVPEGYGEGGFMPYGIPGIIEGAATCFFGFIGFDCIATAGEEAKNPRKSIPIAICVSLAMIFLAYFGISTVLTMMLPYFQQDENAPLTYAFEFFGWTVAVYLVSIGAMCGLCASLMGSMFPLSRIVFALASDGLLFKFMGEIHPRFKTPLKGTLVTGTLTGLLAAIFNLEQLISMMSIGTLLAYSMVASCVLILRYNFDEKCKSSAKGLPVVDRKLWRQLFNLDNVKHPTKLSSNIATYATTLYCVWCFAFGAVVSQLENQLGQGKALPIVLIIFSLILVLVTLFIISRQPVSSAALSFKAPFVPWLPGISILINIYLMLKLDVMTWVRFGAWIAIGLLIYFAYGASHSKEKYRNDRKPVVNGRSHSMPVIQYASTQTVSSYL